MWDRSRALGRLGEDIAARFLSRKGYRILGRNIRTFLGEIDIVARKKGFLVFVEVKTRKSMTFGAPYLSVTKKKERKLIQCALCYLKMKDLINAAWCIDIISIELDEITEQIRNLEHFENAIEE